MLPETWIESLDADGYYVSAPLFSDGQLSRVRAECQRQLGGSGSWAALGVAARSEVVRGFAGHAVFRHICESALGSDVDLYFDSITFKAPQHGKELRWHQDAAYGRTDRHYITCWTALDRADEQSGCLWVAPRSHEAGVLAHTREPESADAYAGAVAPVVPRTSLPLVMQPGQIAVLRSDVLHRSARNVGTAGRLAYLCGYAHAETRFLDTGLASDLKLPVFRRRRHDE